MPPRDAKPGREARPARDARPLRKARSERCRMKVLGLAGWSGSGKTTLMTRLLPELIGRGVTVSTMKHAHHRFDIDQPGKDSYVHRSAGAREVMVASAQRWALMHEHRGEPEPSATELMRRMTPVDLLIIEGFKREPHDKIEVYRAANGKPLLHPEDPRIVAVASDVALPAVVLSVLDLSDIRAIADFVVVHCGLGAK